jgi:hypothetical protein
MAKTTCGESRRISIFWLKSEGYLRGWSCGVIRWNSQGEPQGSVSFTADTSEPYPYLKLEYTSTDWDGNKESMDYKIQLVSTSCHIGGKRFWFICPLTKNGIPCQKRVGILYGHGKWFGCRNCLDLAYACQQETHSGTWYVLGKCLFNDLDERAAALRVKYWKGRPTKRYGSLLRKMDRLPIGSLEAATAALTERSRNQ